MKCLENIKNISFNKYSVRLIDFLEVLTNFIFLARPLDTLLEIIAKYDAE